MPTLPFFLFFIFSIPTTSSSLPKTRKSAALFIFGDSLFDPGNNNYINTTTQDQANFWPYGETYFKYPTGRFSDGRLIPDFIAERANLPLIPPYLQQRNDHDYQMNYHGVNFASAGAGALSETFKGWVIDLKTQLKYYNREVKRLRHKLGNDAAKNISSNAIYLFSIGNNDYSSYFLLNSTIPGSSRSQYVGMVIGNLTTVIKEIYRKGGRKFGLMNLGELGCVPGLRILETNSEGGCLEEVSNLAKMHNNALSIILSKLEQQLHGFKYYLYDFNSDLARKINQPLKYGFKEGEKACCGTGRFNGIFSCGGKRLIKDYDLCENPNEFVFWDSYHLTEKVHKQMVDHMWGGSKAGTSTLKDLFYSL